MKLNLIIIIITISTVCKASKIKHLQQWKRILHYSESNHKSITINNFYFSSSENIFEEIIAFKQEIAVSKLQLVCEFPARYKLLLRTFKDTEDFDLTQCKKLNQFMGTFKSKHLSLMITSELLSSPASAFGHILLVVHDDEKPEHDADIIHFAALSKKEDGIIKYIQSGLTGGYRGHYIRTKYFEKLHEYSDVDQRYIFTFLIDAKKNDIKSLVYHLFELRKSQFKYFFLKENCGYRLNNLLNITFETQTPKSYIYYLPQEVLYDQRNLLTKVKKTIPSSSKANYLIKKLKVADKDEFHKVVGGKSILSSTSSRALKSAVKNYYNFEFKGKGLSLPNYKLNMRFIQNEDSLKLNDKIKNPLQKNKPSKVSIGYSHSEKQNYLQLGFRPVFQEIEESQKESINESELTILGFSFLLNKNRFSLLDLDILSVKVFPVTSKYFSDISWQANLSYNNKNPTLENAANTSFGFGKTYKFLGTISFMLNVGNDYNSFVSSLYISPEIRFSTYLNKLKASFNIESKYYNKEQLILIKASLRYELARNWEFGFDYEQRGEKQEISYLSLIRFF